MSIQPLGINLNCQSTNELLFNGAISQGLNQQLQQLSQVMTEMKARAPGALGADPQFAAYAKRLQVLTERLHKLKRFGGTGRRGWMCRSAKGARQEYRKLLDAMQNRARVLLMQHPAQVQAEATQRYGAAAASELSSIVDSGMPFGLMLVMLAAKLAEQHETKLRGIMRQLEQVSGGQGGGNDNIVKGIVGGMSQVVGGMAGGAAGSAAASTITDEMGKTGTGGGQKSETALKAELQYWNSQYSNTMSTLSNLLASVDKREQAITANLRG